MSSKLNAVTESVARGMNCPMQFKHIEGVCRGAGCMAWRWAEHAYNRRFIEAQDTMAEVEPPRPAHVPRSYTFFPFDVDGNPAGWVEPDSEAAARRTGYCGLAGGA